MSKVKQVRRAKTSTGIKYPVGSYEYNRAYYHLYRKPFLNVSDDWLEGRYKCVCCGFFRRGKVFSQVHQPDFKVIEAGRGTFIWNDLDETKVSHVQAFNNYVSMMIVQCRKFLAMYDLNFKDFILAQELRERIRGEEISFNSSLNYLSPVSHVETNIYELIDNIGAKSDNV